MVSEPVVSSSPWCRRGPPVSELVVSSIPWCRRGPPDRRGVRGARGPSWSVVVSVVSVVESTCLILVCLRFVQDRGATSLLFGGSKRPFPCGEPIRRGRGRSSTRAGAIACHVPCSDSAGPAGNNKQIEIRPGVRSKSLNSGPK